MAIAPTVRLGSWERSRHELRVAHAEELEEAVGMGPSVQPFRLTAGYLLVNGGRQVSWIQETMILVGIPAAFVIIGSTVVLCRSQDLITTMGLAVLVGIGTLLFASAHLSLLYGMPLEVILAPDFLLREWPSVALALTLALCIQSSILLLVYWLNFILPLDL